ncbi:hypothetical protein [Bradyrhizobium sp. LTSP885]|uniref:hypothetical protein n=1 Tax=Bradyrhizobium sp. LTSP885 TaxID=1619232 RepID=UPI0012DFFBD0|nr:hypothetical protein [Bradyrhizobium sp. LTSP885]
MLEVADRLVRGDTFRSRDLGPILLQLRSDRAVDALSPRIARARAVVFLYLAELDGVQVSPEGSDGKLLAWDAVNRSLSLTPQDAFFWVHRYLLWNAISGFSSESVALLEESYNVGPREGWIAILRNRRALAVLSQMDEPSQQLVVLEFAALVDAGLIDAAEATLTGTGWIYRERLLASLDKVALPAREAFAKTLVDHGVKVLVPGVPMSDQPWRRN